MPEVRFAWGVVAMVGQTSSPAQKHCDRMETLSGGIEACIPLDSMVRVPRME